MNSFSKRHIIKIPKNVGMYYCDTKHIIIFVNSSVQKALILKTKAIIEEKNRIIRITREPFLNMSNNEKKKLKAVQGTQVNLLKQMLLDISSFSCKKLNLIGVGFRVVILQTTGMTLLHFKLGYSHYVYFKIPKNLEIFCLRANKLFILGDSYSFVNQVAALVRSFKIPEPYKGKGIIYTTEKITLKEGKKA
jgi:large subunit ribosomal protein L6